MRIKAKYSYIFLYPDITGLNKPLKCSYFYPRAAGTLSGNSLATNMLGNDRTQKQLESESFPYFLSLKF